MKYNSPYLVSVLLFFILYTCTISACQSKQPAKKNERSGQPPDSLRPMYRKPPSSFNDTLVIDAVCAVFYDADSLQQQEIKKISPPMNFDSDRHDCFYQMRNARNVLRQYWPKLKVIETSKARFLLFKKANQKQTLIDLNSKGDMCGIFLFDRQQDPELVDMTNFDTALNFYFNK